MHEPSPAGVPDAVPSFALGLPVTRRAVRYATRVHAGRRRDSDRAPFIVHPLEVAAMLHASGAADAVVAAGVLHDAVELDGASLAEIKRRFGAVVSALVGALTEDPRIDSFAERKAALRDQVVAAGPAAATIFAADKLAKVRELRVRIGVARARGDGDPEDGVAKLGHYTASLAMLERLIPGSAIVLQLRFELEALRSLPPGQEHLPAYA